MCGVAWRPKGAAWRGVAWAWRGVAWRDVAGVACARGVTGAGVGVARRGAAWAWRGNSGGCRTGLRRAHEEVRREEARREVRAQAARMQIFRQQTPVIGPRPRHLSGLSGNALPTHEEHIHVTIGKRSRGGRQASGKQKPAAQTAFKAGQAADRRDCYAVERVYWRCEK